MKSAAPAFPADTGTMDGIAGSEIPSTPATPVTNSLPARLISRKNRYWHRGNLFIVALILIPLVGPGMSGASVRQTPGAPLRELSGDVPGGKRDAFTDTNAVQEAVRQAGIAEFASSDSGGSTAVETLQQDPGTVISTEAAMLTPSTGNALTILLMGVDARPGEAIDVGVRPDTLAVLHLDGETGSCRLLSIPRDTRTELPGHGQSKVNHALAVGGVPYQILVTRNLLGIEIDHYGLIDFSGIEGLVDAVGGVTVVNETAFTVGSSTFEAGAVTLNGEEALTFARYRGGPDGDFGRIGRQQQVVRAVLSEASQMDVASVAYQVLEAVDGHVRTDLSIIELIGLANDYRSTCTEETLEVDTLNGTFGTFPDPLLNLDLSYVIVDPAEIEQKVDWLLGEP